MKIKSMIMKFFRMENVEKVKQYIVRVERGNQWRIRKAVLHMKI
nr:MAG TPA: hypothetical protein [Caudoviricetes sp.]